MATLSLCARSLFALFLMVTDAGSPDVRDALPLMGSRNAAVEEVLVVAPREGPQENESRPRHAPGRRSQERSADASRREPAGPPPVVRLDAAVYRLGLSAEEVVQIDAAALAQAASLVEFDEAVRALGDASVLYRVDQTVNLRERGRIRIVADQPYVTGSSRTKDGRLLRSVSRHDIGAEFRVWGDWAPQGASKLVHLSLDVEVSTVEGSQVEAGSDVTAPVFRKVEQHHSGPVELGQPVVLLNLDGACTDRSGRAVAFITRAVLLSSAP
ncbi:MAG: hypothetical protein ACE5I3_00430 [Phycisphaerae bacterium]